MGEVFQGLSKNLTAIKEYYHSRTEREITATARMIISSKEELEVMSWERVKAIAEELQKSPPDGRRDELVKELATISNENLRVISAFGISLENCERTRSGVYSPNIT